MDVGLPPDVLGELAIARRDYAHDVERLNSGKDAELILKPTITDEALTSATIKAKVKELILWLAVIHLWRENVSPSYLTQASVITKAAEATGRSEKAIKTELSNYSTHKRASEQQIQQFWNLIDMAQKLAWEAGSESLAFGLLLPTALAISAAAIRE